ncbi:MAG: hypothetical protein ABJL55_13780 [Roseibium sp.]
MLFKDFIAYGDRQKLLSLSAAECLKRAVDHSGLCAAVFLRKTVTSRNDNIIKIINEPLRSRYFRVKFYQIFQIAPKIRVNWVLIPHYWPNFLGLNRRRQRSNNPSIPLNNAVFRDYVLIAPSMTIEELMPYPFESFPIKRKVLVNKDTAAKMKKERPLGGRRGA